MPFLRVIRDKRGYETTYLLHWYRDGPRQRSRILYVFRTPGGIRVGRDPLEPDILRQLESRYPDIEFDWPAMREHRQVIDAAPEPRRRRPRRDEEPAVPPLGAAPAARSEPRPAADPGPSEAAPGGLAIPAALEGETPAERIAFLQKWHPLILERIPRRTADPTRQDALFALAARLNPDSWTDADQISAGLPDAAEALERLSRIFARRRRTRRRTPPPGGTDLPTAGTPEAPGDEADPETARDASDADD